MIPAMILARVDLPNQKMNEFKELFGEENVGILTGDRRENVDAPIIIMTTEVYRNMALSNAYGDKNPLMENLGTVIFDEFHYLGDDSRGPVWEESLMFTPKDVQTLKLSATIGNSEELKKWVGHLDDDNITLVSIPSSARHVPLEFDTLQTGAYKQEEKRIQKSIKKIGYVPTEVENTTSSKPTLSDFKCAVDKLSKKEQLPAIFFVFSRKFSRELLEYLSQESKDLTTAEGQKFTQDVLNFMRNKLSDYQELYGDLYNLEATPAESTSYRLAKHDKKRYPNIVTASKEDEVPYYTNSSHLPVGYTDDIFTALDVQDGLQTLYTSGTVFHTFLGPFFIKCFCNGNLKH